MIPFLLGLSLSSLIGWLAYQRQSLSPSGVLGAILTGTLTLAAGVPWALVLIAFFLTSSAFSKIHSAQKTAAREQFSKGEQRDIAQVFANGGIATLIAVLYLLTENANLWLPYLGAFATATADTWATEIGTLSRQTPRSIFTLKPVDPGTSGGMTFLGTLAGMLGALFIGLMGILLMELADLQPTMEAIQLLFIVTLAGTAGSLFDSLLGATLQAMYWCEDRQMVTEKSTCGDASPARLVKGWAWITNDVVNVLAVGLAVIGVEVLQQF
jgi:uncharacterized protein (TIGR00297 family)